MWQATHQKMPVATSTVKARTLTQKYLIATTEVEVVMIQVFLPLTAVFDESRYQKTVETVLLDYDIDEVVVRDAAKSLHSYTLQEHVKVAVPQRGAAGQRNRVINKIMASLTQSVTSCLDRYLRPEGVALLKGLTHRADVTVFANGHRHFYTEIVSNSSLRTILNNGLRVLERVRPSEMVIQFADKHMTWYYLDTNASELARVGERSQKVKLGHLNFDLSAETLTGPWKTLRSLEAVKEWLGAEGLYITKSNEGEKPVAQAIEDEDLEEDDAIEV